MEENFDSSKRVTVILPNDTATKNMYYDYVNGNETLNEEFMDVEYQEIFDPIFNDGYINKLVETKRTPCCCCCYNSTINKLQQKFTRWAYKHPWFILVCLCYASMACTMTGIGFLGVVIQDIEKQYGLSSTHSGLISACLDVAFCCVALLIGWKIKKSDLGYISLGMGAATFGCILFALPMLVVRTDVNQINTNITTTPDSLCFINETQKELEKSSFVNRKGIQQNEIPINPTDGDGEVGNSRRALILFYTAFAFIGMGSAPVFILSPIILKNLLSINRRSTYLSIFYLSTLVGPSIAYFSSNPLLKIPVYLKPIINSNEFIGAWWMCFIVGGIISWIGLLFVTLISVFFHPAEEQTNSVIQQINKPPNLGSIKKRLLSQNVTQNDDINPIVDSSLSVNFEPLIFLESIRNDSKSLKILDKFKLIICNPCYICVSFSSTLVQFLIIGFATFLPKFLENNFTILPERAVIIVGFVMVPSAAMGALFGGLLVRTFKLNLKQICFLCFVCSLVATIATFSFLIRCPSVENITPTYSSYSSVQSVPKFLMNIEQCWTKCEHSCEKLPLQPVCNQNLKVSFLNPCYAGCKNKTLRYNQTVFSDCICVEKHDTPITFKLGFCSLYCNRIYPFSIMMFLLNFFLFTVYVPMTEVTMRVVPGYLLTMALGLQQILQRLVGQVPGPIVIGKLIDLACVYWKVDGKESHCYVYDTVKYSNNMTVIGVPILLVNTIFMFAAYVISKRQNLEIIS